MIQLTFRCGHTLKVTDDASSPMCQCGERQIASVTAPPPRFRGRATGPHCETMALEAIPLNCAPGGPLRLH